MRAEAKHPLTVRFGPFEADLRSRELLKSGRRIKLQGQPFQVLTALLERAGQTVTREELREAIWHSDTFVDFERGLNKAINRLREALGDSVENPKFIETLPRRGYRFIASVERNMRSLAVLPLQNLSGDSNLEHWADGITDELISHVARIVDLRVISRTSVMRFKQTEKALSDIARELEVDGVLEGSVVISNKRIRLRVQLIDPFTEQHLWAESYDRELGDVITLQAHIAEAVARQIRVRLRPEEQVRSLTARRVNPEAYEAYLKGRFFWNNRTTGGLEKGLEYFRRAIAVDDGYAPAYCGLADCYVIMAIFGLRSPHDLIPQAKALTEKALSLDETFAEPHKSLGTIRDVYDWDSSGSEREFIRALELDPNSVTAHQWYAVLLSGMRRYEEAVEQVLVARSLDPLSLLMNAFAGFIYMRAGEHQSAIKECGKAVELDGNNPFGHWMLARSLDAADRTREALEEAEKAVKLSGNRSPYSAHFGYALAREGNRNAALGIIDELHEQEHGSYVSPYDFALIYAGLGEADAAFGWLEKACIERAPRVRADLWEPPFCGLRSDARLHNILRRIGLPAASQSNA